MTIGTAIVVASFALFPLPVVSDGEAGESGFMLSCADVVVGPVAVAVPVALSEPVGEVMVVALVNVLLQRSYQSQIRKTGLSCSRLRCFCPA